MYKAEVKKMLNKRELVLLISLVFCAGFIFSDFTKPRPIEAEVTNIVYDTLNKKIIDLNTNLDRLTSRVNSLESRIEQKDTRIDTIAKTVKALNSVSLDLTKDISFLRNEVSTIKAMQSAKDSQ